MPSVPPYTDLDGESPRECCANLAMALRDAASGTASDDGRTIRFTFEVLWAMASRLERAVARMDEEKALAPKLRSVFETYGEHMEECERPVLASDAGCTCGFTETLARVRALIPYSKQIGADR